MLQTRERRRGREAERRRRHDVDEGGVAGRVLLVMIDGAVVGAHFLRYIDRGLTLEHSHLRTTSEPP